MNRHKQHLIDMAKNQYKGYKILPCGYHQCLEDCFTLSGNTLMLWFNTNKDDSTRMIKSDLL